MFLYHYYVEKIGPFMNLSMRKEFLKKGKIIKRDVPHYMVVEYCF